MDVNCFEITDDIYDIQCHIAWQINDDFNLHISSTAGDYKIKKISDGKKELKKKKNIFIYKNKRVDQIIKKEFYIQLNKTKDALDITEFELDITNINITN